MGRRRKQNISIFRNETEYSYDGINYHELKRDRDRGTFCALFIKNDELYTHSFTLPISTKEENFLPAVEMAFYENGKLDPKRSYKIDYKRALSEKGDLWVIDAFAADIEQIEENYLPIYKKVGYIDLLAISYLAYEGYIKSNSDLRKGNVLVIHIGREDSFVSLFKNGDFIGYNKIYSLEFISRKVSIDIERVTKILKEKGLEESLYSESEKEIYSAIVLVFTDIVRQIERLIRNKKIYFDLDGIDRMILDFDGRELPGFWKLIDDYGLKSGTKESISHKIDDTLPCTSSFDCIKDLYLLEVYRGVIEAPNLSPYRREAPFWDTWVGKLAISSLLSLAIVFALGFYISQKTQQMNRYNSLLKKRLSSLEKSEKELIDSIKKEKDIRQREKKRISEIEEDLERFEKAIKRLGGIKHKSVQRQKMFKDVDEVMQKYNIMCKELEQNASLSIDVDLVVPYERRETIAQFMKDIKAKGYKSVDTDLILLEGNLYHSRVKITR